MPNAYELRVARLNTAVLIDADPRVIQLRRPTRVRTPAGGLKSTGDTILPEQSFTVVPLSGNVWDRSDPTPDEGRLPDVTHQLVGMHDADVRKNDWFPWNEDGIEGKYIVTHVSTKRRYRTSCNLRFVEDGGPVI